MVGSVTQSQDDEIVWYLDSGSQVNVCNSIEVYETLSRVPGASIVVANGVTVDAPKQGNVVMMMKNETTGKEEERVLEKVYLIPSATVNLISMSYLQDGAGFQISFSTDQSIIWATKKGFKLRFVKANGLYQLKTRKVDRKPVTVNGVTTDGASFEVWHQRFGHIGQVTMEKMRDQETVTGLKMNTTSSDYSCVPCVMAKATRMSYHTGPSRVVVPLAKLSVDICSIGDVALCGSTMFLLVVDEATRYRWGFSLAHKGDAQIHIINLIRKLNNQFASQGLSVLTLHGDQGGEFLDDEIKLMCEEAGIEQSFTNGYSPQENAIVERSNRTLVERMRALLAMTRMPSSLWVEAFYHVIHTVNRTGTAALKFKTPFGALYKTKPDVSSLRTWGCVVYLAIHPDTRERKDKLSSRVRPALLISYASDTKGYKVLELPSCKVSTHRAENLHFEEGITVDGQYMADAIANRFLDGDRPLPVDVPLKHIRTTFEAEAETRPDPESIVRVGTEKAPQALVTGSAPASKRLAEGSVDRPQRKRRPPVRFDDFVRDIADKQLVMAINKRSEDEKSTRPASMPRDPTRLPKAKDIPIPVNFKAAMSGPYAQFWKGAYEEEFGSLKEHKTWEYVQRKLVPSKHKVITCRWHLIVKANEAGDAVRSKARLVIHGFKQRYGIDYHETYAPVIRFCTVRVAIYYALQRGWLILQYDVKTAFLHGELKETIFMEQPPGYREQGPEMVCRLVKSLYGLKQAPFVWNQMLHQYLVRLGFACLDSDYGLYVRQVGEGIDMLLTVYVDDLLLMGSAADCTTVAAQLRETFELTALGQVKYLLGVEVVVNPVRRTVFFAQETYMTTVLKRFHQYGSNPVATPESETQLVVPIQKEGTEMPFRELVGALQYLVTHSRPDIAHAVRTLSSKTNSFTWADYCDAVRVLRYLQGTLKYGILMRISGRASWDITVYTDADFSNDVGDRKSISGYATQIDGNTIAWGSSKQSMVAQSTSEAEYVAMNEGAKDLMWLRGLCQELKQEVEPPLLWCDNMATVYLSMKPGKHNKFKHVDNKYHYVRHLVEDKRLVTEHCPTTVMTADIFTKALGRTKFEQFRDQLNVVQRMDEFEMDS